MAYLGSYNSRDRVKVSKEWRDILARRQGEHKSYDSQGNVTGKYNVKKASVKAPSYGPSPITSTSPTRANAMKMQASSSNATQPAPVFTGELPVSRLPPEDNASVITSSGGSPTPQPRNWAGWDEKNLWQKFKDVMGFGDPMTVTNTTGEQVVPAGGIAASGLLDPMKGNGALWAVKNIGRGSEIIKAGEGALDAWKIGKIPRASEATNIGETILTNSKNIRLTKTWLMKILTELKKPRVLAPTIAAAVLASIGTYPWAAHLRVDNALGTYKIGIRDAYQAGNYEDAARLREEMNAFLDRDLWTYIKDNIPWVNVVRATNDETEAAISAGQAYDAMIDDAMNSESIEEFWQNYEENKSQNERDNIDYYNEERMKLIEWENEAAAASRAEEAALWKQYREDLIKAEEESARRTAEFWKNYREAVLEMELSQEHALIQMRKEAYEESAPSNLGFGLIR